MADNTERGGHSREGHEGGNREIMPRAERKPGEKREYAPRREYKPRVKKAYAPRGEYKPGEKREYAPRGEYKPGEKREYAPRRENKPGEKREYAPRGEYKPGEKREYAPRREYKPGEKREYAPRREYQPGEKREYAPRGEYKSGENREIMPRENRKPGEKREYAPRREYQPREKREFAPRGNVRPKPLNLAPRRVALDVLMDVERSDAYASLALDKRLAQANLPRRDRAFVTQLVYGTLENQITLDWRIDQQLAGDKAIEPTVRMILRMGAYQLFYLDRVPDMAAVDESVSLTRAMGLEALTGLTNAVLRGMIRGKDDVVWPKPQDDAVQYLSVLFSAPPALCKLLIEAYGEHGALEILRYRPRERPVTVRVNALRCDGARLKSLFADEDMRAVETAIPGVFKVYDAGDLTRMRAFQNGLFTIQGESSVIAARAVGAKPGQTVLDACAAPGGKTAVLSEMMNDTGRVYAWDTHAHRVELIRGTANRLKLENVRPMMRDASVPRPDQAMTLDAALVDAPCSGTGVMLEKPDVKYRVSEEGVAALVRTQAAILDAIAPMVKVGGTLVYATCSILPQENAQQVQAFLARHPEYERVPLASELPEALAQHEDAWGLQMLAHRDGTDGFFVSRLRRVRA